LRHLRNRKAPGPDEIHNEMLKHLSPSMHRASHSLFTLMWVMRTAPDSWKEPNTILLHMKNDESLLENNKPIAPANTMYKLWTSLLQECLSKHADHYGILSNSREGYRPYLETL